MYKRQGYNKRAIYTLKITDDYFYVNGLIKSKKFAYKQVKGIFFGEIDDLKRAFAEVKMCIRDSSGTILGLLIGLIIGAIRAIKVEERDSLISKIVKRIVWFITTVYIEIFRGTPMRCV